MRRPPNRSLTIALVVASVALLAPRAWASAPADHAPGRPSWLTVNDDTAPLAVTGVPSFGWRVTDVDNNEAQTAYELVVRDGARTIFDSQRVESPQQSYVTAPALKLAADHPYQWTVRTWDRGGQAGPYAIPAQFDTGLGDADWHASWIKRPGAENDTEDDYSLLRKAVRLRTSPITRARVYASAGQQYELFINGVRLAHGPSFAYPDEQYYETTDVTRAVRQGVNNVFAFIAHWTTPGQGRPPSPPGLIAHITIDHADGTRETIVTDGTWRTHAGPWIQGARRNGEGDFVEHVDERLIPPEWDVIEDEPTWPTATVIGPHPTAPFTHLYAARSHIEFQRMAPVSLQRVSNAAYVADFGAVIAATPVVEIHAGRAGRAVTLRGGYLLDPDGHVSTTHGTQETDMHWEFVERAGAQELRPFGYLGFRYLEVIGAQEPLTTADITIAARHASMPDVNAASFQTSNPTLNAVWNLARHSALYDTQEQFLDTPTREKGAFLGDGFDVSQATMDAFGERALTWQALRDFARSQKRCWPDGRVNVVYPNGDGCRDIPDGTENYVQWVWDAYQATGDVALLQTYFPVVNKLVNYIGRAIDKKTGLVTNLPGGGSDYLYGAVDWPPQMRYGYDVDTAARTTMNVLAYSDFTIVDQIAEILHRGNDVHVSAQQLAQAIHAHLVRSDGIYIDGLKTNGAPSTHASQQANAYALAFGLVPDDKIKTVSDYVASLGTNMGVVNFRVLLDAFHAAGRDDALVTQLTDPTRPGYAQMLKEGATFTWESWDARQTGDSESHGWGSTVLAVLQDDILGVRAIEPGAARVAIGIPNSSITSAHGVVATQRGPIAIAWTRTGTHTKLDVTIPPNVVAQLPGSDHNLGSGHHVLRDYKLPAKSDHSISWLLVALGIAIAVIALVGIVWLLRRRRPA